MFSPILLISFFIGNCLAQYQTQTLNAIPGQNQTISLNPIDGSAALKLRIVFQSEQPSQNNPCSTGNCPTPNQNSNNIVVGGNNIVRAYDNTNPCSTGNCPQASVISTTTTTSTPTPTVMAPLVKILRMNTNQLPPLKVIRVPSYSNNLCGASPFCPPQFQQFQPFQQRQQFIYPRRFFAARPIFRSSNTIGTGVGVPDTIYKNGMAIRAPIQIPSSYKDGNPVFNSGK